MSTMTHDHEHIIKLLSEALAGCMAWCSITSDESLRCNGGNFASSGTHPECSDVSRYVSWRFRAWMTGLGRCMDSIDARRGRMDFVFIRPAHDPC